MKTPRTHIVAAVCFFCLFFVTACGSSEKKSNAESESPETPQSESHSSGPRMYFQVDTEAVAALKKGDSFMLATEDSALVLQLQIRRVEQSVGDITAITANIENKDTGLATLLFRDQKLTGLLHIYPKNMRYQIRYDSTKAAHYLKELQPEDLDELEGSEPLIPKKNVPQGNP